MEGTHQPASGINPHLAWKQFPEEVAVEEARQLILDGVLEELQNLDRQIGEDPNPPIDEITPSSNSSHCPCRGASDLDICVLSLICAFLVSQIVPERLPAPAL